MVSAPIPATVCVAVFAVVNVVALVDVGLNGALPQVPRRARMIPETRFDRTLARGAFHFGVELGTGLMALALYASVYALLLTPLATRDFFVAAPAVLGWAVGRSLPLVSRALHARGPGLRWAYCWPDAGAGRIAQTAAWAVVATAAVSVAAERIGW